ncbi:MAG TPA: hypothetical protein VFU86_20635 [Terriglobales bacterium]|nr:hypothetical protein [Terriglobales bacterium]
MRLGRQIFEGAIGKILLPWVNLGFTAAMITLVTEMVEAVRGSVNS